MPKVTVNDIEMYYEISGQGDPLVLIHGLGSSRRDWEDMIPLLPNFQIITLDLRGHGQTSKPKGPYTAKMFANRKPQIEAIVSEIPVSHRIANSVVWFPHYVLLSEQVELEKVVAFILNLQKKGGNHEKQN